MNSDQAVDAKVEMDESLLRQAMSPARVRARALREQAAAALRTGRAAAKTTDTWVHEHPWSAIGMAAGVGCLVGWLVARR